MLKSMSQTQDPSAWCAAVQAKLMAALDAAWALIEKTDDPAVIARARAKARACGQLAACARTIARMVPAAAPAKARREPIVPEDLLNRLEAATTQALTPQVAEPAAQAVAMRAALRKLGRGGR